jgi:hypothetical protein
MIRLVASDGMGLSRPSVNAYLDWGWPSFTEDRNTMTE